MIPLDSSNIIIFIDREGFKLTVSLLRINELQETTELDHSVYLYDNSYNIITTISRLIPKIKQKLINSDYIYNHAYFVFGYNIFNHKIIQYTSQEFKCNRAQFYEDRDSERYVITDIINYHNIIIAYTDRDMMDKINYTIHETNQTFLMCNSLYRIFLNHFIHNMLVVFDIENIKILYYQDNKLIVKNGKHNFFSSFTKKKIFSVNHIQNEIDTNQALKQKLSNKINSLLSKYNTSLDIAMISPIQNIDITDVNIHFVSKPDLEIIKRQNIINQIVDFQNLHRVINN